MKRLPWFFIRAVGNLPSPHCPFPSPTPKILTSSSLCQASVRFDTFAVRYRNANGQIQQHLIRACKLSVNLICGLKKEKMPYWYHISKMFLTLLQSSSEHCSDLAFLLSQSCTGECSGEGLGSLSSSQPLQRWRAAVQLSQPCCLSFLQQPEQEWGRQQLPLCKGSTGELSISAGLLGREHCLELPQRLLKQSWHLYIDSGLCFCHQSVRICTCSHRGSTESPNRAFSPAKLPLVLLQQWRGCLGPGSCPCVTAEATELRLWGLSAAVTSRSSSTRASTGHEGLRLSRVTAGEGGAV